MDKIWIVAADSTRARIFEAQSQAELKEIETLTHGEGRLQEQELQSDRPGRTFDSRGDGRHAYVQETDPKVNEAQRFARAVVDYLEQGRNDHRYERLLLVAAPAFLGQLRESMHAPLAKTVSASVAKNVVTLSPGEIRQHLPDRL